MVDLWTCQSCDVLLGMDIFHHMGKYRAVCVSCGEKYTIENIGFIDINLLKKVIQEIENKLPVEIHPLIRYRWLSNRTAGILIDEDESEIHRLISFDLYEYIEDELADSLSIFITLDFE